MGGFRKLIKIQILKLANVINEEDVKFMVRSKFCFLPVCLLASMTSIGTLTTASKKFLMFFFICFLLCIDFLKVYTTHKSTSGKQLQVSEAIKVQTTNNNKHSWHYKRLCCSYRQNAKELCEAICRQRLPLE